LTRRSTDADLLLSFQNDLSLSLSEDGLNELLASVKLIALDSSAVIERWQKAAIACQ
jgi:hypothetical protein